MDIVHELDLWVPDGYELKGWESLQNKWFDHRQSAFLFNNCDSNEYTSVKYGEPYTRLLTPDLSTVKKNGTVLMVFDQPHYVHLRTLFRSYTKADRFSHGITHFFVMAYDANNYTVMKAVFEEAAIFHDILLFDHENSYANLALSVLLSHHYLQSLELPINYVIKMDSDCAINFPRLFSILHSKEIQRTKFLYGGDCLHSMFNSIYSTKKNYVPSCLVQNESFIRSYARGGLYVISYNLLTPLLTATRHMQFITHLEDANTGRAMSMIGITCLSLDQNFWLARYGCIDEKECRQFVAVHPRISSEELSIYYKMIYKW